MKAGVVLMVALISLPLYAMELGDAKVPTQAQLTMLLSGNTINGEWDGRPFAQYFEPSGSTRYREGSGPESKGAWRVNAQGQYCSVWPPSPSEACYDVLVKGLNLLWLSGGKVHPSLVTRGFAF